MRTATLMLALTVAATASAAQKGPGFTPSTPRDWLATSLGNARQAITNLSRSTARPRSRVLDGWVIVEVGHVNAAAGFLRSSLSIARDHHLDAAPVETEIRRLLSVAGPRFARLYRPEGYTPQFWVGDYLRALQNLRQLRGVVDRR